MDPHDVTLPDANEITPHAITFARMMFAHAALEREINSLQDAITNERGFGEQRSNQWSASESATEKILSLITKHYASDPRQIEQIKKLLKNAVHLCGERNFLAHGTWWCFNRRTLTVEVRGGEAGLAPEHRKYTVPDIEKLADKFKDIEAELYTIRRSLARRMSEAKVRAASSFLRAP
jgi:hypothetical protein